MGTKVSYKKCKVCGELGPSSAYFFAKGELTDEEKEMCFDCVNLKRKEKKHYD